MCLSITHLCIYYSSVYIYVHIYVHINPKTLNPTPAYRIVEAPLGDDAQARIAEGAAAWVQGFGCKFRVYPFASK